jgi:hypothetical protein
VRLFASCSTISQLYSAVVEVSTVLQPKRKSKIAKERAVFVKKTTRTIHEILLQENDYSYYIRNKIKKIKKLLQTTNCNNLISSSVNLHNMEKRWVIWLYNSCYREE